jgi:hypothetical protein
MIAGTVTRPATCVDNVVEQPMVRQSRDEEHRLGRMQSTPPVARVGQGAWAKRAIRSEPAAVSQLRWKRWLNRPGCSGDAGWPGDPAVRAPTGACLARPSGRGRENPC